MSKIKTIAHCCAAMIGFFSSHLKAYPVTGIVTNLENRSFEGELKVLPSGVVTVDVSAGNGSATYTFKAENIGKIEFLDAELTEDGLEAYEKKQYSAAIDFLKDIHRHRSPFFKLFPSSELAEPSLALGESYLKEKQFANATGVAGVLLGSKFLNPKIHERANDILLLAFFGLERWDETEVLAKRWCESHEPYDESALGWWILSEVHLARKDFEKARWISLQPITFRSQFPKDYLQNCYHVAIASWIEEFPERALQLYREYQDRRYSWPEDRHLQTKLQLEQLELSKENALDKEAAIEPLTIDEGAPKKDLNLPLKSVRKLTTVQESNSSQ